MSAFPILNHAKTNPRGGSIPSIDFQDSDQAACAGTAFALRIGRFIYQPEQLRGSLLEVALAVGCALLGLAALRFKLSG
jgi:hypothetical protein